MARQFKKWADHSPRWQRDATRQGLIPQRWNRYQKLSENTRKSTDPRKYAAGQSVAQQRKEGRLQQAAQKIRDAAPVTSRKSVIERNVKRMTDKDVAWTLKATPDKIRNRAGQKHVAGYHTNPFWYR